LALYYVFYRVKYNAAENIVLEQQSKNGQCENNRHFDTEKNVQEPHNGIVRFYKIANKSAVVLTLTKRSITKLFKAVSFLTVLVICKKFCKLLLVHEDYQNVPLLFLL